MTRTSEKRQKLWLLAAGPSIWGAHFAAIYLSASIWCAKVAGPGGPLANVRIAVAIYTGLALSAIAWVAALGYRRHRHEGSELPHDADSPADRHRFLGFAIFLLSLLSAVAVLYQALTAVFFEAC